MTAVAGSAGVLDPLTLIDLLRFAEVRGDDALAELLAAFGREAADRVARLRATAAGGDLARTGDLAHGLRGSSLAVAATAVAERCADIEHAARDGDADSALQGIDELAGLLEQATAALQRALRTATTTNFEAEEQ